MVAEEYPCYIQVADSAESDNVIELPTESDGRISLTTIKAQFPDAIGLRFRSEAGNWRGVGVAGDYLEPPLDGWGSSTYVIAVKKAEKRKMESSSDDLPESKKNLSGDLIVLGLPYAATLDEVRDYFAAFGELASCELKVDPQTKKSKGFGFIRFTEEEVTEKVLASSHTLAGRTIEVAFPTKSKPGKGPPSKLFVGRVPKGTTEDELRECFSKFGPLSDVYIPHNFRGFGFVKFTNVEDAEEASKATHVLKGAFLNVMAPDPKGTERAPRQKENVLKSTNMNNFLQNNLKLQQLQMQQIQQLQQQLQNKGGYSKRR